MSTAANEPIWMRWLVTLLLGTVAAAGIWLAGAPDIAFVGYALAAVARS